jgi:putative DNA primase/helicase
LPKAIVKKVAEIIHQLEKARHFLSYGVKRSLWTYYEKKGIWNDDAESIIRRYVANTLHKEDEYRSQIANEVVHALRDIHYQPEIELGGPPHIMVVANGRVNIDTGEFYDSYDPNEYHIARIPVAYDPEAKCPRVCQFFTEVLAGENDILAMEEEFGYCLYKGWIYDILIMLIGAGANGKNILMALLETFLGPENVSTMTLHALANDQFAASHLFGMLANLAGEIPRNPLKYTSYIKDLSGGGTIYANIKHEKGRRFKNNAKMIFSSNSPPPILDDTYGWWRRLRRVDFPNTFARDDPKTIPRDQLLEYLTTEEEMSGLLNRVILGWQRLRAQGYLTGTKDPDVERIEYLRISDPARYLAEVFMEQDSHGTPIIKQSMYEVYLRWCTADKRKPESPQTFHDILRKSATYIAGRQKRYPADEKGYRRAARVYANVRLKTEELEEAGVDLSEIDLFFEPVTDGSDQETLIPESDKRALLKLWTSRNLDCGSGVLDISKLTASEQKTIDVGITFGLVKNDPTGEHAGDTYSLTSKGLNEP